MSWLKMRFPGREAKMVEQTSQAVAKKCRESVDQRLSDITHSMSLPEVRGYIRSRAGEPIRREVRRSLRDRLGLSQQALKQIIGRATEQVVHTIIRDLLTEATSAMRIRRAA